MTLSVLVTTYRLTDVHGVDMKIDCEARDKYQRAVEEAAREAEKNKEYAKAHVMRMRSISNTSDSDCECG